MYLISMFYINPANNRNTSQPNFFKDSSNLVADESIGLVNKVNNTNMKRSSVILDLVNEDVVKLRNYPIDGVPAKRDYAKILEHFRKIYPREIEMALEIAKTQR